MERNQVKGILFGLITAAAIAAGSGLWAAESAAANTAPSLALDYTCSFPVVGSQTMRATIVSGALTNPVVGRATSLPALRVTATLGTTVAQALRLAGATAIKGTADMNVALVAPQGNVDQTA
jgi:hypothetical protein